MSEGYAVSDDELKSIWDHARSHVDWLGGLRAVFNAGQHYHKLLETVEELDTLPDDSVIRSTRYPNEVLQVFHGRWSTPGVETDGPSSSVPLPAIVLFSPFGSDE